MKTKTIIYFALLFSLLGGLSVAVDHGSQAYMAHILITRMTPTPEEKERWQRNFDKQVSTASTGAMIVLFQAIGIFYVRKFANEKKAIA